MEGVAVYFKDREGNEYTLGELIKTGGDGAVVMLTHLEYEIHQGRVFTFNCVDETMADAATLIVAFKTGSGVKVHFTLGFNTLVGGHLELWEGVTWTTNTGTATAVVNRRRTGTTPSPSTLLEDKTATPVFTATGKVLVNPTGLGTGSATSLRKRYAFAAQGKTTDDAYASSSEITLKKNTQYAVVFTGSGANNKGQIILNWIEGTGKD